MRWWRGRKRELSLDRELRLHLELESSEDRAVAIKS